MKVSVTFMVLSISGVKIHYKAIMVDDNHWRDFWRPMLQQVYPTIRIAYSKIFYLFFLASVFTFRFWIIMTCAVNTSGNTTLPCLLMCAKRQQHVSAYVCLLQQV